MRMSYRDFLVGWRLLLQEPVWSGVVIAGLAVGFTACILLLGFVRHSFSYDRHVPASEQIHLVKTRFHFPNVPEHWTQEAPQALRQALRDSGLPVSVSMFAELSTSMKVDNRVATVPVTLVDPEFGELFGVQARAGELAASLRRPDGLALTEETANKLFGAEPALGRTVGVGGMLYRVTAIVPTPPATTTMPYAALVGPTSSLWQEYDRADALQNWGRLFGRIYVKPLAGSDPMAVADALQAASDRSPLYRQLPPAFLSHLGNNKLMDVQLVPLADAYLDPDLAASTPPTLHGDMATLLGLAGVAALILVLASVNYVNLATVRTLRRQREIGIRKVLGASVTRVMVQFLCESLLLTLLAMAAGLLLAWLALPLFADIMNRRLDQMFSPGLLLGSLLLSLVLGLLAGAYPAWVASRVRPTQALAGRDNSETASGLWLRRILTVTQLATAMGLTGVTLAVAWQSWYASRIDAGFDAKRLLVIDVSAPFTPSGPRTNAFAEAVARLPGVAGAAQSMEAVGRSFVVQKGAARRQGGAMVTLDKKGIGPGFFDVYGIQPLAGRVFNPARDHVPRDNVETGTGVVLSATAAKALGYTDVAAAVGQFIELDGVGNVGKLQQVLGVVPDVRFQSLREIPPPVVYNLSRLTPVLTVKVAGDMAAVQTAIEGLWPRYFPNEALQMSPAQTFLAAAYAEDLRLVRLLLAAAVVVLAIAGFGVYVLAAYLVQRLTREIVLRKLHGARRWAIAHLVNREFMLLLLVSAMIGLPAAAMAIQRYLSGFVEHAPIGGWTLLLALLASSLVAIVAAARHTRAALQLRPSQALNG